MTRYDVAQLIGRAWGKAATSSNGVSALKSCGIYPFDPTNIPDHYFALSDSVRDQNLTNDEENQTSRDSPSLLEDNYDTALIHDNDIMLSRSQMTPACYNKEPLQQNYSDVGNEKVDSSLDNQSDSATKELHI